MTNCSVVAVLALAGFTKKRFGHNVILKILSLRSPRIYLRCDFIRSFPFLAQGANEVSPLQPSDCSALLKFLVFRWPHMQRGIYLLRVVN